MGDVVNQLLPTDAAVRKLGARGISVAEADQTLHNGYVVVRNLERRVERVPDQIRRLLVGRTNGNRLITLIIEATLDPTTWLLITGWDSTGIERRMLED